jgi:hypothetical protein
VLSGLLGHFLARFPRGALPAAISRRDISNWHATSRTGWKQTRFLLADKLLWFPFLGPGAKESSGRNEAERLYAKKKIVARVIGRDSQKTIKLVIISRSDNAEIYIGELWVHHWTAKKLPVRKPD